jgi:hypothetical protein
VVALAATAGGLLLTDAGDLGERVVSGAGVPDGGTLRALSGLDDNTKLLLEVRRQELGGGGVSVWGGGWGGVGGHALRAVAGGAGRAVA